MPSSLPLGIPHHVPTLVSPSRPVLVNPAHAYVSKSINHEPRPHPPHPSRLACPSTFSSPDHITHRISPAPTPPGFYLYPPGRGKISGSVGKLILGPYQGRPACLSITPIAGKGVCADAFTSARGIIVDDVNSYPGHIG
jgi:hypothetical protein